MIEDFLICGAVYHIPSSWDMFTIAKVGRFKRFHDGNGRSYWELMRR